MLALDTTGISEATIKVAEVKSKSIVECTKVGHCRTRTESTTHDNAISFEKEFKKINEVPTFISKSVLKCMICVVSIFAVFPLIKCHVNIISALKAHIFSFIIFR